MAYSLPPVPPQIASATSLIPMPEDMITNMPNNLKEKLFYLLGIKHTVQNGAELTRLLNLLIHEIIKTNKLEIDQHLILTSYPQMVKSAFRSSIKQYFVENTDQDKRTAEYKSIYNTTWSTFADYLLKKVTEHFIPITVSTSPSTPSTPSISSNPSSSSSEIPTLQLCSLVQIDEGDEDDSQSTISINYEEESKTMAFDEEKDVSNSEKPPKRRKTVRFEDAEFYLPMFAEVAASVAEENK